MADDAPSAEDERQLELSTISDIFPELIVDADNAYSASIDLPVTPCCKIPVVFPEAADGASIATVRLQDEHQPAIALREVHLLSHLPSIHLDITLPKGYPEELPPLFRLSTTPQWLSASKLESLRSDGDRLWEEYGRSEVIFAYIDHLRQAAENAFDLLLENEQLPLTLEMKIGILDFDIKAKKAAFDKETFDCGVCLEPKKGVACHRMLDCGHVFCCACLQDFYNNAITEGDLAFVRCLAPDCAKKRAESHGEGKRRKPKTHISPSELLQIPLEQDMVQRYVTLKHKAELESDKNTIYCPRKWCQGAARSKKHRKPSQFLDDDDYSDEEDEPVNDKGYLSRDELLAICEDCSFAFCRRCYRGWHGESFLCIPATNTGELTEEDKASLEYLKLHTTPCPTCAAPAQKTHGCNHMICFRCNSHFCYLCSAWLDAGNPYKHFNMDTTACFMRLWELEGGDGDDVGHGFGGAGAAHAEDVMEDQFAFIEDDDDDGEGIEADQEPLELGLEAQIAAMGPFVNPAIEVHMAPGRDIVRVPEPVVAPVPPPAPAAPRRAVEREAPLVLRLAAPPPPPVAVPEVWVPAARGGRGGARGARGGMQRGGNMHNMGYNARRDAAIARRVGDGPGAGARAGRGRGRGGEQDMMDEADQVWVQRFVMAALNDEEHMIDEDA